MELFFLVPELFWGFLVIGLVCEFGEMVSSRFIMFNDHLEQCRWYLFPIEMQRMFIVVTVNTQRSTVIHAFGNAECSREANKKVRVMMNLIDIKFKSIKSPPSSHFYHFIQAVQASFSYFMMLRQMTFENTFD